MRYRNKKEMIKENTREDMDRSERKRDAYI